MKEKKILPVTELNHTIIELINNVLNDFCFGKYKERESYPVSHDKNKITTSMVLLN
jgi:hypothetical protein